MKVYKCDMCLKESKFKSDFTSIVLLRVPVFDSGETKEAYDLCSNCSTAICDLIEREQAIAKEKLSTSFAKT